MPQITAVDFFSFVQWKRNKGKSVTDLLDQVPLALQAELFLASYKRLLERVSGTDALMFAGYDRFSYSLHSSNILLRSFCECSP